MNVITKTLQLADGRTITIETGKVAKQTDGSVVLRMNNTVLLATVCAAKDAVPGTDFMPLQVDYREQYSAAGRFPGGFTKREGKASDNEILTSRLVDRVLRPLFPSNYHAEVFVNVMLLSADGVDQPDALAGFAASAALACSDIPFECPISEVRVARINGEYVINPTFEQMKEADMDIMVGARPDELISAAEKDKKETIKKYTALICGLLDFLTVLLLFIPVFGNGEKATAVPLFGLNKTAFWIVAVYAAVIGITVLNGICAVIISRFDKPVWNKHRLVTGVMLSVIAVFLFITTRQPYAGIMCFTILIIKGFLLIKGGVNGK